MNYLCQQVQIVLLCCYSGPWLLDLQSIAFKLNSVTYCKSSGPALRSERNKNSHQIFIPRNESSMLAILSESAGFFRFRQAGQFESPIIRTQNSLTAVTSTNKQDLSEVSTTRYMPFDNMDCLCPQ